MSILASFRFILDQYPSPIQTHIADDYWDHDEGLIIVEVHYGYMRRVKRFITDILYENDRMDIAARILYLYVDI